MGTRAIRILTALFWLTAAVSCRKPAVPAGTVPVQPQALPERTMSFQEKPLLTLSFAGDIMAHDVNYTRPPYDNIYAGVKDILTSDDLSFGNLEFPVYTARPMSNYPLFNVSPEYVEAAVDGGFDVFSAANNHSADQGAEGVLHTRAELEKLSRERGISFSGLKDDSENPVEPASILKKGWDIGFLSVTEFSNCSQGKDLVYHFDYHNKEERKQLLTLLDEVTPRYDIFILSYHGGTEYATSPSKEKAAFFDELTAHGVDIIWGHHPHVLQPWYADYSSPGGSVIIYSNGNFISGQTWRLNPDNPDRRRVLTGDSSIFQILICIRNGTAKISKVRVIPIANYKHPEHGMVVRKLEELQEDKTLPQNWRRFYSDQLLKVKSLSADFSIPNILH